MPNLKPGTWELHKYVEDRWMNVSNINILVGSSSFYELSFYYHHLIWHLGFPGDLDSKESACNVGDLGLTPGLGRSPRGGHGHPYNILIFFLKKYLCLSTKENSQKQS